MNNKDLLKAIGDIDDKYLNEEINTKEKKSIIINIIKNSKSKYIFATVCFILVGIIGIYKSGIFTLKPDIISISKKNNWIIKEVKMDQEERKEEIQHSIAILPKWEKMSISQQFFEVEYNNSRYSSKITKISSDNILNNIGSSILKGYDEYNKITHNKNAQIYSIKNLSDKCAIALKFEGDNEYYVYVNAYYKPATLGEFMNDLRLKEITSFGTIEYNYWDEDLQQNINIEFYNVDNEIIWQKLFNDISLENIYSDNDIEKYTSERFTQSISISVDIPILGYKNISVSLTDKGYLLTNILDTGKGFYIGENKVKEFLNYIKENYNGYQIVYINKDEPKVTEYQNNIEEQIIMTENKTNNSTVVDVVSTGQNRIEAKQN